MLLSELGALQKVVFWGEIFLKFFVFIGRINPSDDQNLDINRKHVIFVSYTLQSIFFQKLTILCDFSKHFWDLGSKNLHDMMKFYSPPLHIFQFRRKTLYILSTYENPSKFSAFLHSDILQHALSNETTFRVPSHVTFWVSTNRK